ncbi:Gamma-tubulin complex component [Rhynchospora pubera]|uniref:Gamma-tubulin complex component n=1 Tax=Rhynchospora pubera TaxID=906938 RepID=A0AAV8G713_9POAL|nr:Gamma-tubulin complex component [Rhynchospora pubera]
MSDTVPATPRWNLDRPFLTGRFHQEVKSSSSSQMQMTHPSKPLYQFDLTSPGNEKDIASFAVSVQEPFLIEDLLYALVGIEGRYISIKRIRGKEGYVVFQIDTSMDLALQELTSRIFPLCEGYVLVNHFVESRSHFKNGFVNHALAAAIRAFLLDYQAMVAQLEHQFRLGKLSSQGLWFFCQRMMSSMNALAVLVEKAIIDNVSGSATLNLLESQVKAMAGDNAVRSLLERMTECASAAYFKILERWVYEGVIDDPYGEFFISENKSLQKESLTEDYDAKYWEHRYKLKDGVPYFLRSVSYTILTTGKYLNVMRECGHHVQVPLSENSKLTSFGPNHEYLERIKAAYDFASGELLTLIKNKYDLIGKLRSLKRYLLVDQGDFLVHFMDIAREELSKSPKEVSAEKLESLLDLALRMTAAASDPCHEELTCCVEKVSLQKTLATLKDLPGPVSGANDAIDDPELAEPLNITGLETFSLSYKEKVSLQKTLATLKDLPGPVSGANDAIDDPELAEPLNITGLETFSLSYKVQWPLSLVISRKALTKYQMIFRLLFHCKHVSRQLCTAWQLHQGFRACKILGTPISRSSILCRSMLKFINSLLHYLTFEVLEPNWHMMHDRLLTAKSIDEVIEFHDLFLHKCLKECLLLMPQLLKKVEKLKALCLRYATSIQVLIPSMNMLPERDTKLATTARIKQSQLKEQQLKLALENTVISDSIMKFENEFNVELQSLVPILSRNNSQSEPYLTHLAQCILGIRSDQ